MVPEPNLDHQRFSRELEFKIYSYIKSLKLHQVFNTTIALILDENVIVQPELVFISKEKVSIKKKKGIFGSPDLIVEIISESSIKMARYEKFKLYEKYGVQEYWLLDPLNKTMEVFSLENNKYEIFCFSDEESYIVNSKIFKDLDLSLKEIFIFINNN